MLLPTSLHHARRRQRQPQQYSSTARQDRLSLPPPTLHHVHRRQLRRRQSHPSSARRTTSSTTPRRTKSSAGVTTRTASSCGNQRTLLTTFFPSTSSTTTLAASCVSSTRTDSKRRTQIGGSFETTALPKIDVTCSQPSRGARRRRRVPLSLVPTRRWCSCCAARVLPATSTTTRRLTSSHRWRSSQDASVRNSGNFARASRTRGTSSPSSRSVSRCRKDRCSVFASCLHAR
mmetsp:Transcript_2588/g.5833  ORF Transcript_2588/g.5833 Transcript_2588/m.5833 type:complete len:232 (-) Transcript_2588:58-753(-)